MDEDTALEIGQLERMSVRGVWPSEPHNFTPWLLHHPEVLGDLLGMDLRLEGAEHPVGDFSLDLVGTDAGTGERVIVENQLEASDHTHLGQLLTYAAGTQPTNIVWVCTQFRDEHRAALDWLNERTDSATRFFGVEVAAVRIGDSLPAPLLSLAASPNDWGKRVRKSTTDSGRKWTEAEFLAALERDCAVTVREEVHRLMRHMRDLPDFSYWYWGTGTYPSVTPIMKGREGKTQPWALTIAPDDKSTLALNFDWIHKSGDAFSAEDTETFAAAVERLPGYPEKVAAAREAGWRRRPSVFLSELMTDPTAGTALITALTTLYRG